MIITKGHRVSFCAFSLGSILWTLSSLWRGRLGAVRTRAVLSLKPLKGFPPAKSSAEHMVQEDAC